MFHILCGAALGFGGATTSAASLDDVLVDSPISDAPSTEVVGGAPSIAGSWPATVALIGSDGWPTCTGTLIATDVVLTAAHCVTPEEPTQARVGSIDATSGGELIQVASTVFHPSYDGNQGADIAIVHLASPATTPAVVIGTDCVADQLVDGAPVTIAGFGATNAQGTQYPDLLHEAASTIQDADCSQDVLNGSQTTCEPQLRPGGELAAGGGGVDSCYGDSGGPLYMEWQGQTYVVGVTSRGFAGQDCGSGGVYLRPDSWMSWIETQSGTLPRPNCYAPPTPPVDEGTDDVVDDGFDDEDPYDDGPDSDPTDDGHDQDVEIDADGLQVSTLVLQKNTLGALTLDPMGMLEDASWTVVSMGQADDVEVRDGTLLYTPRIGFKGQDLVVVDVDVDGQSLRLDVPVLVVGKGCDQSGGAPPLLWLIALVPMLLRGRRQR